MKVSQLLVNKFVRYFVVPFFLILLWFFLSVYTSLTYKTNYTVLPYNHITDFVLSKKTTKLYKNNILKGEVLAKEHNLGVVAVRLKNLNGPHVLNEDEIIFRIKEKGSKNWYYENSYSGGQFHELDIFPFGFPLIADSQGKRYYFEIHSQEGNVENALTLLQSSPQVMTHYQFLKNDLLNNHEKMLTFVYKKFVYGLSNFEFYFTLFVFLFPLLIYIFTITFGKKLLAPYVKKLHKMVERLREIPLINTTVLKLQVFTNIDWFLLSGFLIDILFIEEMNNLITVFLLLLWGIRVYYKKYSPLIFFLPPSMYFVLMIFLLLIFELTKAEKAMNWIILFLAIGILLEFVIILKNDFQTSREKLWRGK